MATQKELAEQLKLVLAQQKKTLAEIDTLKIKITDLETVVANGDSASQELTDAVQAVRDQAQVVDDSIPDATPTDTPAVPPS